MPLTRSNPPATGLRSSLHSGARDPQLAVRSLGRLDWPAWNTALNESTQTCVFLRPEWSVALADAFGRRSELLACVRGGKIVGGLVGALAANGTALDRVLLSAYSGVWVRQSGTARPHRSSRQRRAVLGALAENVGRRFTRAEIDCHPDTDDVRPFVWAGWQAAVRYTCISSLSGAWQASCDPDVRRRVARAEAAGVRFESDVPVEAFDRLWSKTHARQGLRRPLSSEALIALVRRLLLDFDIRIHGARLADGTLAAANVVIYDGSAARYWLAAFDPLHASTGANQFCLMQTLQAAAGRIKTFDWIGANTKGVAEFKESFGPRLVPSYRLTWSRPDIELANARSAMRRWFHGVGRRFAASSRLNGGETC